MALELRVEIPKNDDWKLQIDPKAAKVRLDMSNSQSPFSKLSNQLKATLQLTDIDESTRTARLLIHTKEITAETRMKIQDAGLRIL